MIELPAKVSRPRSRIATRHDLGIVNPRARAKALSAAAVLCVLTSTPSHADEALARSRACLSCHTIEKKLVGPALRDVANRYVNDRDAEARLAQKIRVGGSGAWGTLAMAPNPAVTEADARTLARWVLSLKTARQP